MTFPAILRVLLLVSLVPVVATVGSLPAIANENGIDETEPGSSDLAASLFTAILENNRALKTFDMMFESEYLVQRPGSELVNSVLKVRYIQGGPDKRLYVRSRDADRISAESDLNSTSTLVAYVLDEKPLTTRIDATGRKRIRFPNVEIRNFRIGLPRFHSIGFITFPHIMPTLKFEDPYWTSLTVPSEDAIGVVKGERTAMVIQKHRSGGKVSGITTWVFDLETLMPDKRTNYFIHSETGKRELKEVEDYTWKSISGVNVPVKIRCEVKQIAVDEDSGTKIPYSEIYDSRFMWKTVNSEVPDDVFSMEKLSSMRAVQELIVESLR